MNAQTEELKMCALFGYLDPGTGSMLLQALMGGFAGLMVLSKLAWQSVLPRFLGHTALEDGTATE